MSKPRVHFVHANSFPAGTYRLFFHYLRQHYEVDALAMHAHNPAFPVQNGWHALMLELIAELESRYAEPVILVGHSMGGMLSLMAAKARPDLARAVVLLDSPVVAGWRAALLGVAKACDLDKRFSPARFSEKRRMQWRDKSEAFDLYAAKPMFARWQPEVLRDYVEHGLVENEKGATLRFTRETETAVYRTLPHHIGRLTRGGFPVPVGFIGGTDSAECRQAGLRATRRLVGPNFRRIDGGHLFPMEHPAAAAHTTHQIIDSLLQAS